MAEYIERDEAIRRAVDACVKIQVARTGVGITQFEAIDVADAIYEIPTADVVEVRHGEVLQKDHDEWWGAVYECCVCNEEFMLGSNKRAKCCPYCGAYLSIRGEGDV